MTTHAGGCLCGALRYETTGVPDRIVFCHCKFCQRATGTAFLLEAMFPRTRFRLTQGTPARYELTSAGSGKRVVINFCQACGTKLWLDLDRVPGDIGLYTGTYDDPNWFERLGANSKHIFLDFAQRDTLIHAGVPVFHEHVTGRDGAPATPVTFDRPHQVR
jgi:hypothetical protein